MSFVGTLALLGTAFAGNLPTQADSFGNNGGFDQPEETSFSPVGHRAAPAPVVGGNPVANASDWPDVAGIVINNRDVECTGTLIASDLVITAGHCNIGITDVILGTNDYDHPGEEIEVIDTIEYPDSQGRGLDLTLLILDHDSQYTPRPIANYCERDEIRDGAAAMVVGYGATDPEGWVYTSHLNEGATTIQKADCPSNYGCQDVNDDEPDELFAGGSGADACYGDSGGPLYVDTPDGFFLAGVTSRGAAPCGSGGIWVRPDNPTVLNWIEEETGRMLPGPDSCPAPEPTAAPIETKKNTAGMTKVEPNDEDSDEYTFEIHTQANSGNATVDEDGNVTYHPENGFHGDDNVTVRVWADGQSGDITIPVHVKGGFLGCDTSSQGSIGALALILAAVGVRRRRS